MTPLSILLFNARNRVAALTAVRNAALGAEADQAASAELVSVQAAIRTLSARIAAHGDPVRVLVTRGTLTAPEESYTGQAVGVLVSTEPESDGRICLLVRTATGDVLPAPYYLVDSI